MTLRAEHAQSELALGAAQDRLARARARLVEARKRHAGALRTLAAWYRSARARTRRRAAEYRQAERERIKREIAKWWDELRALWDARRQRIDALGLAKVERAKRVRSHERDRLRELGRHKRRVQATELTQRAREQAAESDDEVIANLEPHHPELVPVFRELRRQFKASPRMSRTEAVLQWAHDHPAEVASRTMTHEDRELRAAIEEHERAEREAHRHTVRAARPKPARRYAEAVPF